MARLRGKYRKDANGKKRLQYYYAEFYDVNRHPAQKRISLGTRDRGAALQALAEMEKKYMAGLLDPWHMKSRREGKTVSEAIALFMRSRKERQLANSTLCTYRVVLESFARTVPPGILLQAVEPRHVAAYLEGKKRAEATRKDYADRLRIFFAWCREEELTKDDPTPAPSSGKRARLKRLPKFLDEAEYQALLRAIEADAVLKPDTIPDANRWLLDVVRFAVGTGLRRGELCNLRWSGISPSGNMLTVKNTEDFQTKSGRERAVPLTGEARAVIARRAAERKSEADDYVFKGTGGNKLN